MRAYEVLTEVDRRVDKGFFAAPGGGDGFAGPAMGGRGGGREQQPAAHQAKDTCHHFRNAPTHPPAGRRQCGCSLATR